MAILRALTVVVAGACLLGTAGLIDLRQDADDRQAAASERTSEHRVATHAGPEAEPLTAVLAGIDPLRAVDGAARCLSAGPACAADDLLDVDTTRVRAAEVARLDGGPAAEADQVASALATWLADGCGGSIDGVALSGPVPGRCGAEGSAAASALEHWTTTIRRSTGRTS